MFQQKYVNKRVRYTKESNILWKLQRERDKYKQEKPVGVSERLYEMYVHFLLGVRGITLESDSYICVCSYIERPFQYVPEIV